MPAQSKSQQRFFGVVKAMQKGDIPKKGKAGKIAKSMSKDDVDDFASTKHKGKPEKVKREQRVRELIKKMVREELAKMNEVRIPFSSSHIKQLKRAFKDMKGTLPDNNPLVQQIVTLLKKTDKKVLKQIANADIKYLSDKAKDILGEGTCGYGENGELGEEPAGPHLIKKKRKSEGRRTGTETSQAAPPKSSKEKKAVKIYGAYIEYQLDSSNSEYMHKDQRNKLALKMLKDKFKIPSKLKGKLKNKKYHDKYTDYRSMVWEGKLNEAKETIFDVAARVMKDKQAYGYNTKKGLVTVDVQTANLLTKVFKKVNPKMKKILSDLGYKSPTQLMNTLWAVVK